MDQWGVAGTDPGQLDQAVGLAVDATGRVYLASRGTGFVEKFESNGVPLLTFADAAARNAAAVAVDHGGGIYVADLRAGEVHVFFPEGDMLRVLRVAPQRNFVGPFGFSAGADGAIFVPDSAGGRVQVLSPRGGMEKVWKMPPDAAGKQAHPVAAMAGADGSVYVADARSDHIVKFNGAGEAVGTLGDSADEAASVLGLAVSQANVFVLRGASPYLEAWTLDGRRVLMDDLGGRWHPEPAGNASLAVGAPDQLFVFDPAAPRVLRFRIHLSPP